EIIIDFEDAILVDDRKLGLERIKALPNLKQYWYRIPLHNDSVQQTINFNFLEDFLEIGVRKLVLPKLKSADEYKYLSQLLETYSEVDVILLVEHPRLLIELGQI